MHPSLTIAVRPHPRLMQINCVFAPLARIYFPWLFEGLLHLGKVSFLADELMLRVQRLCGQELIVKL